MATPVATSVITLFLTGQPGKWDWAEEKYSCAKADAGSEQQAKCESGRAKQGFLRL